MCRELCVKLIRWYQRYVSPYKGFSCAHRALQGGVSCSGYALHQFQTKKPLEAYRATRARMRACGELYRKYLSEKSIEEQKVIQKRMRMRLLLLIVKRYLIRHWPKRNQRGGVL